ncbi:DUF2878 domain-containing protein [Marinicella rhabdoformis]|uniref:DUF2878 domain-containing protein n=1 Tax=Marinicella rhabdoformis TaxID=2580566 RepID=UPI0012AEC23F|nr:DUF2878 domain-containing protein [Marinicella rhabdoformis]
MNKSINFVLFLLIWPAAVFGAANNQFLPMWLILVTMFVTVVISNKPTWVDIVLFFSTLIYGYCFESLGTHLGWIEFNVIEFNGRQQTNGFPPHWILALWGGLGLTFRHSNAWLFEKDYKWLIVWLACVPMTYFSAAQLGVIKIESFLYMYVSVFMGWSAYFFLVRYTINHPVVLMTYQAGQKRV